MSIHLDPFKPEVNEAGISFFADINATRVRCVVTNNALGEFQERSGKGATAPLELFKQYWTQIQAAVYAKIQDINFRPDGDIVLCKSDFKGSADVV